MPSARTAPSPFAPALLGCPQPSTWSPGTCCSAPAPVGGRRPPRRLWRSAPANPGAARLLGRNLPPRTFPQQTASRTGAGDEGVASRNRRGGYTPISLEVSTPGVSVGLNQFHKLEQP